MMDWTLPATLQNKISTRAIDNLRKYFGTQGHIGLLGRHFEFLDGGGDRKGVAYEVTYADTASLALLSTATLAASLRDLFIAEEVEAGSATFKSAKLTEIEKYLKKIPADATIEDEDGKEILRSNKDGQESDLLQLWREVHKIKGFGSTRVSKLLARKRPHLVPIYDSRVARVCGAQNDRYQWAAYVQWFEDAKFVNELKRAKAEAGVPDKVSLLRVLDVMLWMEGAKE